LSLLTSCRWSISCERVYPRQVCWIGIRSRFIIRVDVDTAATTTTSTKSRCKSARTSFRTPTRARADAGALIVLRHGVDGLQTALGTECMVGVLQQLCCELGAPVDENMNADRGDTPSETTQHRPVASRDLRHLASTTPAKLLNRFPPLLFS
jgi:hypothetical protein